MGKLGVKTFILILSVSAVIGYGHYQHIDRPYVRMRLQLHDQILSGSAPSPYRYRVAVPFTAELFVKAFSTIRSRPEAFLLTYKLYDILVVFFLLASIFLWSRNWFSRDESLVGTLFVAATMPIALQDHYFQPWSLLEVVIFTAALQAIYRKRYPLLVLLTAMASFNRETGIFIPLAFFFITFDVAGFFKHAKKIDGKPVMASLILFSVWAAIFLGLRYVQGGAPHVVEMKSLFARNTAWSNLMNAFVNAGLLFGGFWWFAVKGFRSAPKFLTRAALIIPFYLATVMIWGVWVEVRLLMPLYPVVMPLGLSFLYRHSPE